MPAAGPAEADQMPMPGMKRGGAVHGYKKGGAVKEASHVDEAQDEALFERMFKKHHAMACGGKVSGYKAGGEVKERGLGVTKKGFGYKVC